MHNLKAEGSIRFGAKWGLEPGRQHLRSSEKPVAPKRQRRAVGLWSWWGGRSTQPGTPSTEGHCWSRGADVIMKDSSALLDKRRGKNWAHRIFSWKYPMIWRPLCQFFQNTDASFLNSTLNSFWGWWRSVAIEARGLLLVKVDGKCQFLDGSFNSAVRKSSN